MSTLPKIMKSLATMTLLAGMTLAAERKLVADEPSSDKRMTHGQVGTGEPAPAEGVGRSVAKYSFPSVKLTREDGSEAQFPAEANDGRDVVLTFIFTTCRNICPIMSHVLAKVQSKLGNNMDRVHLMSITLDPEYDTPARLAEYAKTLKAGKYWNHYTGDIKSIIEIEKAFNVYSGDKMNHQQVYFVRRGEASEWVRLQGFVKADYILRELKPL